MAKKFVHEEAFRGSDLLKKLASKQIVLCGVGALGSNLADLLCRQGVANLRVIDMDRVEAHNIGSQIYGDGDIGAMKVNALKTRLFRDTSVEIETIDKELKAATLKKSFKDADLVIDSFDNTASRRLVRDYCKDDRIPCLHLGLAGDGYGECIWNERYKVPEEQAGAVDTCEYPMARNLIVLLACIGSEEIMAFLLGSRKRADWCLTLKDLKISRLFSHYLAEPVPNRPPSCGNTNAKV